SCCASGPATVSAITFGFAPGYAARTTTVGGATLGYSLTGRLKSAIAPPTTMRSESTAAKIGRGIKNCASLMIFPSRRPSSGLRPPSPRQRGEGLPAMLGVLLPLSPLGGERVARSAG